MKTLRAALALTFLLVLALRARAQEPKPLDPEGLDFFLAKELAERGYPGLSVGVLRDGKIVFAKGYGKSSLAQNQPVTPETMFGIGSVTKQFTSACILLLAEDGKLAVTDKVAKYYPKLTKADDITLYDLMTHTSGYPDYYPLDFVDRRMLKPIALDKLIEEYATGKLDFEPRTRWSYSNTGYIILGRVIERVSGEPYEKFLERRILKPLGMEHTVFEPKHGSPGMAQGYMSFALGSPEPARREAPGWIHAAGGLYSTPTDLLKWDLALMEGKLLKPESYKLLTTPAKLTNGASTDYGCGISSYYLNGNLVLSHSGGVGGFVSLNAMLPESKSGVVMLTNCEEFLSIPSLHRQLLTRAIASGKGKGTKRGAELPIERIPTIQGPEAKEAASAFVRQLQKGDVDRKQLGDEFNWFLTPEKVQGAAERLGKLGEPKKVELEDRSERGGMEVATVRFEFPSITLKTISYRTPDGKIQQLLIQKVG